MLFTPAQETKHPELDEKELSIVSPHVDGTSNPSTPGYYDMTKENHITDGSIQPLNEYMHHAQISRSREANTGGSSGT